MNLNTIAEVKRPAVGGSNHAVARRLRMACRRHLAVLGAAGCHRHAHRPAPVELAGAAAFFRRPRHRGHVHRCGALPVRRSLRMAGTAGRAGMLQLVPGVIQDLERGHRRRQHLHVAAGGADDLADGGARGHLHLVAAHRTRTRGPLDRFRDRQPHQRSPTRRAAPQHPLAGIGAVEAVRVPSPIAHASRTLGGAVDRHAKCGWRRSPDHDHRLHPSADPSCGSSTHHLRSSCGAQSTSVSRQTGISTTSTARPPTSATSPTISPSRSAPSWRNPERAHET